MTDFNTGRQSRASEDDVMTRARRAAESATESASGFAEQASGFASKAASTFATEAQSRATGIMKQQMSAGADYVRMVSETAHNAASGLEEKAPELARMVHHMADRANRFADDLRKRDIDDVLDMTWDYARRNPRVFIGGAIAAGFLLARFAKSSAERTSRRYEPSNGASDDFSGARRAARGPLPVVTPGASAAAGPVEARPMPDDRFHQASPSQPPLDKSPGALLGALLADFNDLVSKEIALAKGELARNISDKLSGSIWMAVSGGVFLVAMLTAVAGVVFLIASSGIAMHWAAFIVAGALAIIGAIMLFAGKSKMSGATLPERSMSQVKQDVRVVKEQMQ